MPFPHPTPYDILEVSPSVGAADLTIAYQKAMKERRYPPGTITQAFNELRNPRKRTEVDLFVIAGVSQPEGLPDLLEEGCSWEAVLGAAPAIPITLAMTSVAADGPELPACKLPETAAQQLEPARTTPVWIDLPQIDFPDVE
jgi:hypothetical protein